MWLASSAIIKLVLVAFLGFSLYRRKYIDDKVLSFLTSFVIKFTVPFLIFSHLTDNADIVLNHSIFIFLAISIVIFFAGYILGLIFSFRKSAEFRKEFISTVSLQNSGYLPMNIAFLLFSSVLREEFLVYIFLYILGFDVIFWSVGSFFIFKKKGEKFRIKSLFTPPIISTALALLLIYTLYARTTFRMPFLIISPLKMVGDTSFVLSMLILGSWLARVRIEGIRKRLFALAEASVLKLILLPLLFLLLTYKLGLLSLLGVFIVLEAAMPSAASLPIIADLRGADNEFISQGVFFTHILSIFTIPAWLYIMKLLGFNF